MSLLAPFDFEAELRKNFQTQKYRRFQPVNTASKPLADKCVKGKKMHQAIRKLREHIREELETHRGQQLKTRSIRDYGYSLRLSYYRITEVMRQEFENHPGTTELHRGCWLIGK